MLEYARWKYLVVVVVLVLGLLFASPNFFGSDPALQMARKDHAAIDDQTSKDLESFLKEKSLRFEHTYIDSGHLIVRFADVPDQLAARDAVNDSDKYKTDFITALSFTPRTPGFLRFLRPMP